MFNISKYAKALPSLLGLKERGQGPRTFSETIVGTINAEQLYLLENRELVVSTSNLAPVVGSNSYPTPLTVPAGEVWYVWAYAVTCQLGAGEAIDMAASVGLDGLGFSAALTGYVAGAATNHIKTGPIAPFYAPSGTAFEFLVRSITLAPDVTGQLCITRLKQ